MYWKKVNTYVTITSFWTRVDVEQSQSRTDVVAGHIGVANRSNLQTYRYCEKQRKENTWVGGVGCRQREQLTIREEGEHLATDRTIRRDNRTAGKRRRQRCKERGVLRYAFLVCVKEEGEKVSRTCCCVWGFCFFFFCEIREKDRLGLIPCKIIECLSFSLLNGMYIYKSRSTI